MQSAPCSVTISISNSISSSISSSRLRRLPAFARIALLAFVFWIDHLLCPSPASAQSCQPAAGVSPCAAQSGIASLSAPLSINLAVGNPIHPLTGTKHQDEIDAPPLPGPFGLEIRRHFNSAHVAADGPIGRGWALSYDTRVFQDAARIQILQADGRRLSFRAPASDRAQQPCEPEHDSQGQLLVEVDGYRWIWPRQRELRFDRRGLLVSIGPVNGARAESVRIERDTTGRIIEVIDPARRRMQFHHDDFGRLARIDHPLGSWHYRIDPDGRLLATVSPDGVTRGYRYEDDAHRWRFTSIEGTTPDQASRVLGRWRFDATGRAVAHVRPDGSELKLSYEDDSRQEAAVDPGSPAGPSRVTILTNATGARTRYTARLIAGEWRPIRIEGPGCDECGPTNLQMAYDDRGRLIRSGPIAGRRQAAARVAGARGSGSGGPDPGPSDMHYRYDAFGRVTEVLGSPPGKSRTIPLGSLVRFEYGDPGDTLASSIIRPSIVPEGEHRITIERDERGNPIRAIETGFSPATPRTPAAPVAREIRFRQATIGEHRQTIAIDGPMPNGPLGAASDSDVTQRRFDPGTGLMSEEHRPDGTVLRIVARDVAGRPTRFVIEDAFRRVQEDRSLDIAGRALRIERTGWRLDANRRPMNATRVALTTTARYDAGGRMIESTDPAGRSRHFERDARGRIAAIHDARGYSGRVERNAEGQTLRVGLHEPGQETPLRAAYFQRNADGALRAVLWPDGRSDRFIHDSQGQPLASLDSDGILRTMAPAGSRPQPPTPEVGLVDDFSRTIGHWLADHGLRTLQYDDASRITEAIDGAGTAIRYTHDAAGRLLTETLRTESAGADTVGPVDPKVELLLASYRYEGPWLVSVDDPHQNIRLDRDAFGRVIATHIRLSALPGRTFTTTTRFDPSSGIIRKRGLADGMSLALDHTTGHDGAAVKAIRLHGTVTTAISRLARRSLPDAWADRIDAVLPSRKLLDQIIIHPFNGLAGFRHENGVVMQRRFDPAGRLTNLSASGIEHTRHHYDRGPRLTRIDWIVPAAATGPAHAEIIATRQFAYDRLGRLAPSFGARAARRDPLRQADPVAQARDPVTHDAAGRMTADARHRYAWTPHGQLESVSDAVTGRLIARYAYNHRRERVKKIVHGADGEIASAVHFLWQDGHLTAEIDESGIVRTQYLALRDARGSTPYAKVERDDDGKTRIFAVHTEYRGAPIAMTNDQREIVWRGVPSASGLTPVQSIPGDTVLNLRLPGQYFDAETGLHDNHHRTYDPTTGRYLQPDPLGYPAGADAYAYAGGDPINRSDPTGLYEEDIHYYMTFFLSIVAGYSAEDARVIALAAQYVDENPITKPVDASSLLTTIGSMTRNQQQLLRYHFVLSGADGKTLPQYQNSNLVITDSPQLNNLLMAAGNPLLDRKGQLVLFGEYLHAVADTFSHRDADNRPFDALVANCGVGHGHHLHEPDLTYDSISLVPTPTSGEGSPSPPGWQREARTLTMEEEVFKRLATFSPTGPALPFDKIAPYLEAFNKIRENDSTGFSEKIKLLRRALDELGFDGAALKPSDSDEANVNRDESLHDSTGNPMREEDFPGVCLPNGTRCLPV